MKKVKMICLCAVFFITFASSFASFASQEIKVNGTLVLVIGCTTKDYTHEYFKKMTTCTLQSPAGNVYSAQ